MENKQKNEIQKNKTNKNEILNDKEVKPEINQEKEKIDWSDEIEEILNEFEKKIQEKPDR